MSLKNCFAQFFNWFVHIQWVSSRFDSTRLKQQQQQQQKSEMKMPFDIILNVFSFFLYAMPLNKWKTKWSPIAFQYSNIKSKHAFYAVFAFDFNDFQLEWIPRAIDIKSFVCLLFLFSNRVFPPNICQKMKIKTKIALKLEKIKDATRTE